MAEFWKSAPRFWCKQCKIYIRDTAFEKSQHEASGKHQGNLKRFLRDIHRDNERQQRESQKAKDEVERLRQSVSGSGSAATPRGGRRTATAQPPPASTERPVSVDERKKQMAQLAEMGISIPEEYRGDMALAGDWQTTSVRVIQSENENGEKEGKGTTGRSIGVRKRKLEGRDNDDEDDYGDGHGQEPGRLVSKGWGQRTKEYPGAQGDDDEDLDALLASTKNVKKVKPSVSEGEEPEEPSKDVPGVIKEEGGDTATKTEEESRVKEKEPTDAAAPGPELAVKEEPEEPASGVVFKKRKPKTIRK